MPIKEWIETHFKYTNDMMASENIIGYTSLVPSGRQCSQEEVRLQEGKNEAGEVLICRLYRNRKEGQLNVDVRWKV